MKDSYLDQHVEKHTRVVRHNDPSLLDLLLTDKPSEPSNVDHTPPLGHGDHALLQATFSIWTTRRNKIPLNYKKRNHSEKRPQLDGMQYNPSINLQQNWENFQLSLEKATKKHVPVMKLKMNRQNNIPLTEEITAVIAEESRDGGYPLETRHSKTTDFVPDGETK